MRAQPQPDYSITVHSGDRELGVLDVSVGGFGVSESDLPVGDELPLRIELPRGASIEARAEVRYVHAAGAGLSLVDPSADVTRALGAYVGELLERGAVLRP